MAFTVEDGTGLADANAYISVEDATLYHADRRNDAWDAVDDSDRQVAIILATDYIDLVFRFRGQRRTTTQALQWPRSLITTRDMLDLVPDDAVPAEVEKATAELALAALDTDLLPNSTSTSGQVIASSKGAGQLSISSTLQPLSRGGPVFRKAKQYLQDLLAPDDLQRA